MQKTCWNSTTGKEKKGTRVMYMQLISWSCMEDANTSTNTFL